MGDLILFISKGGVIVRTLYCDKKVIIFRMTAAGMHN